MRQRPRVLWALNHATLVKSECALLEKLGCEILTPKVCPKALLERSGSIDYSYDRTLTIAADDLAFLNNCDFYAQDVDPAALKLLRTHFDAVFLSAGHPTIEIFHENFGGLLVLRAFGRENSLTYSHLLDKRVKKRRRQRWRDRLLMLPGAWGSPTLLEKLVSRGEYFLFGGCYREVIDNEPACLRATAAYLPIGVPREAWAMADSWTGGDDRVMFVCPCVHLDYYGKVYADFRSEFGDLPFAVYGNQSEDNRDPDLVGFLPRSDYDARMSRHAVMFYHSSEPCHLHYHPVEAVAMGMPLVYMAGGMLERIGGPAQPGLCRTPAEAKEKLRRIIAGDRRLVDSILAAQPRLLDQFRDEFIEAAWRRELLPRLKASRRLAGQ